MKDAKKLAWLSIFVAGETHPDRWEWEDLFNAGYDFQQKKIDAALDILAATEQTETVVIARAALDGQ